MTKSDNESDTVETDEQAKGATSRPRPRRAKKQELTEVPQLTELQWMLALVASDSKEVDSIPNVSALSAVEAAEALAAFYTKRAKDIVDNDIGRKERTRGLILIGALAAQLSEAGREEFAGLFATLEPRDIACIRSVDWARLLLDRNKKKA